MTRWRLLSLALLALLPSACQSPHGMYQRAVIRIENGQACFSVNDRRETRRTTPSITAAYVTAYRAGTWRDIWDWYMPYPTSIPLRPDQCIAYGFKGPPGMADVHESLLPGTSYLVVRRGEVPNPYPGGDPTIPREYRQEFCVRGSEIVLVPIVGGRAQWDVCGSQDTPAIPGFLTVPVTESLPSGAGLEARNTRL